MIYDKWSDKRGGSGELRESKGDREIAVIRVRRVMLS